MGICHTDLAIARRQAEEAVSVCSRYPDQE
jgi:hypothetical protein